jgi:hypothetical protein
MTYTRQESGVIKAAYDAILQVCELSHNDTQRLLDAVKLERAQHSPLQTQATTWARARVVKYWHKGATRCTELNLWNVCDYRPGVLTALMLGASHARKMDAPSDARLARHARAIDYAPAAIAAYESEWNRALDAL